MKVSHPSRRWPALHFRAGFFKILAATLPVAVLVFVAAVLLLVPLNLQASLTTPLVSPSTLDISSLPDPATTEMLADSLYTWGEFDAAALEYKRALYYSELVLYLCQDTSATPVKCDTQVTFPLLACPEDTLATKLKLALSLYRNGERNQADSILYSIDGPVVRMVRAVILVEEEDPYLATRQLDSTTCAVLGAPAFRLRGWAYLEAKDFESAGREFEKAGDDSLAAAAAGLKPRLKNPRTARWLSLLPGLGETYAGRPLFGLWALLVNAGDTYLVVSNLLAARYVDAILAYNFLWQRFYTGSMANADKFANEWNRREYERLLEPIRQDYGERDAFRLDLEALDSLYALSKLPE